MFRKKNHLIRLLKQRTELKKQQNNSEDLKVKSKKPQKD